VLVGVGGLGRAIMGYDGFRNYGLNIVAAFDVNESVIDTEINGKPVYHMDKLDSTVKRFKIQLGIICVPSAAAQGVADSFEGAADYDAGGFGGVVGVAQYAVKNTFIQRITLSDAFLLTVTYGYVRLAVRKNASFAFFI